MQKFAIWSALTVLHVLYASLSGNCAGVLCRYAHFHKDQVEVDQKDEHLIHVIDTPYTYIDDDMTEEMLKVAAKIREQVHDQLWELS